MWRKNRKSTKAKRPLSSMYSNFSDCQAEVISREDLSKEDNIVAIMGPTGSGKSSFIEIATGSRDLVKIGHDMKSCTQEISVIKLSNRGVVDSDICFVDTPGFDDTNMSDLDILKMISAFLNETYQKKIRLTGLLYFHRITDNRMCGTALKNLHIFEELCGEHFGTVVLTTTMWDRLLDEEEGLTREEQLKEGHWRIMISRGSSIKRFSGTPQSAFEILTPIFNEANSKAALLLQREMNDLGLQLKETAAGRALYQELQSLIPRRQRTLEEIRSHLQELKEPEQALVAECAKVLHDLESVVEDLEELHIQSPEHLRKAAMAINWTRFLDFFRSWGNRADKRK